MDAIQHKHDKAVNPCSGLPSSSFVLKICKSQSHFSKNKWEVEIHTNKAMIIHLVKTSIRCITLTYV